MIPRATYRLQFHKDFPFARAAELADYFGALGISHIYASPVLTARAGSTHGYDVVDFSRINPELGGEAEFRRMAAALRARGIGIILDIVPNHMAVGKDDNPWWLDVLKNGRTSTYADYFDIGWDALGGKLLAPFLDGTPDRLLAQGDLKLVRDTRGTAFIYFDNRFPLRPEDEAGLSDIDFDALTPEGKLNLLADQHYILADWREANARINWRRFFDITELAGLRMENDDAFEAVHAKTLALYAEGFIDGLRIDHIDGLADPRAYCRKLRACLDARENSRPVRNDRAYLIVEKILARDEALPSDWDVDGTTGYDFMEDVSALLHCGDGYRLSQMWHQISGRSEDFEDEEVEARKEMLDRDFAAQRQAASEALDTAAGTTVNRMRDDLSAVLVKLRCYRTYATGKPDTPPPGPCFEAALGAIESERTLIALGRVMRSATGKQDNIDAVRRFNQLAAPVAAKAVEDTAFYRYGRLLSRNEVGSDPRVHGLSIADFHRRIVERAKDFPHSMLTTATHDHKRGEDARARLAVLSEIPDIWEKQADAWLALAPLTLDRADVYQLLQTIVGVWPLEPKPNLETVSMRVQAWCRKFLREAKLRSSWTSPATGYEKGFTSFANLLLRHDDFVRSVADFVDAIAPASIANSLAQILFRTTMPGVPDLYQGRERWDFSLVDPDNRTPVDFGERAAAQALTLPFDSSVEAWRNGRLKQALVSRLLRLRHRHLELFTRGGYEAIPVEGARARHVAAFRRGSGPGGIIVAAALHCAPVLTGGENIVPATDWWSDTALVIEHPGARPTDALLKAPAKSFNAGELFAALPVSVLVSDERADC